MILKGAIKYRSDEFGFIVNYNCTIFDIFF